MLRFGLVLLAFSGCVSFPYAHLVSAEAQLEVVKAPVVCGPIGFRKLPLQARWGEYVKVTVASPGALEGTALVHAGGVALEPFAWSTDTTGALVVEARFPNDDPDRRFVLERERPIDVTLTGLEGTCEGAVFTLEQGVLVPTIEEHAWMAELERRGGPELAARREAARVEAEARRQAHYAAWEARQHVVVSAEVVAQAEVIRQHHYAQWEARRSASQSPLPPGGEGQGEGLIASAEVTSASTEQVGAPCRGGACGASGSVAAGGSVAASGGAAPCSSGACGAVAAGGSVGAYGGAAPCSGGACGANAAGGSVAGGSFGGVAPCSSGACGAGVGGPVAAGGAVAVNAGIGDSLSVGSTCGSGTCGSSGGVAMNAGAGSVAAGSPRGSGACGVGGAVAVSSVGGFDATSFGGDIAVDHAAPPCVGTGVAATVSTEHVTWINGAASAVVSSPAEWSQPSDTRLRATAQTTWAQPSDAQLRAGVAVEETWSQPYQPRLEPVAVSTETRVVGSMQVVEEQQQVEVVQPAAVVVPAMFQLMFNLAAAAGSVQQQQPVHGARPAR